MQKGLPTEIAIARPPARHCACGEGKTCRPGVTSSLAAMTYLIRPSTTHRFLTPTKLAIIQTQFIRFVVTWFGWVQPRIFLLTLFTKRSSDHISSFYIYILK